MTNRILVSVFLVMSCMCAAQRAASAPRSAEEPATKAALQQFADLGKLELENGQVIQHCKIGFRTLGTLNSDNSNAVLIPTWFAGRSADLVQLIGPGRIVDDSNFFVIIVDAIGDGISCSASNSLDQHGTAFPAFSIADMVKAEHRLVTEKLHLQHLHAVVGISMGGIQAFQWSLSYPEFMDRVVPIVGTPQPTAYDLLFWNVLTMAFDNDPDWKGGNYTKNPSLALVRLLVELNLSTPEFRVERTSRAEFSKFRDNAEHGNSDDFDANDRYQQLRSLIAFDLARGAKLQDTAAKVKAKVFVISSLHDHMVNPLPALSFAKMIGAPTLVLESNCGHGAPMCEMDKLSPAVNAFLIAK